MNNFFVQLKKQAQELRLTAGEKQVMRVRLYETMQRSPLVAPAEKIIPERATPSPYYWFAPRIFVPLSVVLVVLVSTGTAYAAQGALPGDVLYPVKINVDETVETSLATTPQAQAQVNASLAEERLEEAEALASQGKLDATTSAELATNFDEHAQAAQTITNTLQTQDPNDAAQISAEFDSSLEAHDAILTQLGDESDSTTTSEGSDALAMHIRSHERGNPILSMATPTAKVTAFAAFSTATTSISSTSTATTIASTSSSAFLISTSSTSSPVATTSLATTTASTTPENNNQQGGDQSVAVYMQGKSNDALTQLQNDYSSIQSTLSSTTISEIDARIAMIQAANAAGATSLGTGDFSDATQSFTQGLRLSVQLDTYLTQGNKFNKQLLSTLLGNLGTPPGKGGEKGSMRSRVLNNK